MRAVKSKQWSVIGDSVSVKVASSCQVLLLLLSMLVFVPTYVIQRFRPADGLAWEEAACGWLTAGAECGQMGCSGCKYEACVTGEGQRGGKEGSGHPGGGVCVWGKASRQANSFHSFLLYIRNCFSHWPKCFSVRQLDLPAAFAANWLLLLTK